METYELVVTVVTPNPNYNPKYSQVYGYPDPDKSTLEYRIEGLKVRLTDAEWRAVKKAVLQVTQPQVFE